MCDVSGCGFTREITHKDNSGDGRCDSCNKIMILSYAEFLATADGETVVVEAHIQALHSWQGESGVGTASIHAESYEGGYYFHMLNCSSAEYSTLELGTGIVVRGTKDTYNGEVRVISGEILEILPENWVVVPEDMTDIIDDADELIKHQNRHVYFKNLIFSSIELGYNQYSLKFYYENILYTFILKDSLIDNTSKTSIIAKNLAQGDIVDVSAFLYWNNGATPYISGIKVTSCAGKHIDGDFNQSCDKCGEAVCTVHFDFSGDNLCDRCGEQLEIPHVCADNDGNGFCDDESCKKYLALQDIYWTDRVELIMQINTNTQQQELSDRGMRYLAGEGRDFDYSYIDDLVANRNNLAYENSKVSVMYDYLADDRNYGWGQNIESIYVQVSSHSPDAPDIYVNFIYDMTCVSLKGAFANLYSTSRGQGNNYFGFSKNGSAPDGYMIEYMQSLSLSAHKMYLIASDYTVDVVRAATVIPVNLQLLESAGLENSSLASTKEAFLELVKSAIGPTRRFSNTQMQLRPNREAHRALTLTTG